MRTLRASLAVAALAAFVALTARAARADGADRWLPETTAVYVSVDDVKATAERFASHPLKSLWDEPRMQKFLEGPLGKMQEMMEKGAAERGGATAADLLKIVQGQVVFAVTGVRDAEGGSRRVGLLLLAEVGDGNEPLLEWIRKIESTLIEKNGLRRLEDDFRGVKIVRYEPKEPEPAKPGIGFGPVCWFLADGLWGVSADPDVLKDVLVRKGGGEEPSLATNAAYRRAREVVGAGDLFVYVGTSRIWDVAQRLLAGEEEAPEVFKVLETLGLKSLQAVAVRASLTPQGVESRGFALSPPPHQGVMKLLDSENSALVPPRFVPANVQSAAVLTLDLQAVWKEARKCMDRIGPGMTAEMDKAFADLKTERGIDIQADLIGSLGKTLTFYQMAPSPRAKLERKPVDPGAEDAEDAMPDRAGPAMPRVVFAIGLSNPAAFSRAIGKLLPDLGIGLTAQDYMGTALWLPEEGGPLPIGAGVVGNHLVIAMSAEDLKHVVRTQGQAEAGSLATSPEFLRAMEGLPATRSGLSYTDPRRSMDQVAESMGVLGAMPFEMDWLNLSLLPVDLIKSYLDVGGSAMVREADGFSFVSISRVHKP
jgi:hypothetical protein